MPPAFYVPGGPRRTKSLELSEKQEEMLLSDLAAANRRNDLADVVHLSLTRGIMTAHVTGFRPGPEVRVYRYPVDPEGLKKASADVIAALGNLCLGRNNPGPDEDRLRSAGVLLFKRLFRPAGLAEYFRSRKGAAISFFLPPELFFLPLECAVADDFFSLSFVLSRLAARTAPAPRPDPAASAGLKILSVPGQGRNSFCRKEISLLSDIFRRTGRPVSFVRATRQVFGTAYSSSRQVHFVGHGTSKKGRLLWHSEDRSLALDPSAGACSAVPEFVFSSACNPSFFTEDFSSFLSGLFDAGLGTWIGPMTETRRDGAFIVESFYRHFARGKTCGEALLEGRKESREKGNRDWPVLGLCGDPFYRLGPGKTIKK